MGTRRIFFGYFVVAALTLTSFIPLSLGLSCAGIFYPALSADLGVGAGLLGYYTSILWLAAMVALPFMGRLLNSCDARIAVAGAVGGHRRGVRLALVHPIALAVLRGCRRDGARHRHAVVPGAFHPHQPLVRQARRRAAGHRHGVHGRRRRCCTRRCSSTAASTASPTS